MNTASVPSSEPSTEQARGSHAGTASAPASTRISGVWIAVVAFTLVLLLLAVFLLQNGQRVQLDYLGAQGRLPLAVAMLLSAVAGALLVAMAGVARVLQLRHAARRARTTG